MRRGHTSRGTAGLAWKALAAIMLVNGTLGVLAPRLLIRSLGVKPDLQPAMIYVFRMFGIRTLFIALDLFRLPADRERSLREGVVVHATDATAALNAALLGQIPFRPALMVTALSTVNTILAVTGARAQRHRRRS